MAIKCRYIRVHSGTNKANILKAMRELHKYNHCQENTVDKLNNYHPKVKLTVEKRSILDVAAALDPPLKMANRESKNPV